MVVRMAAAVSDFSSEAAQSRSRKQSPALNVRKKRTSRETAEAILGFNYLRRFTA